MKNSKRFNKIYIEITNVCNLACSFCHGTKRAPKYMTKEEFTRILEKIKDYTDYIYLHLMGEPLLCEDIGAFIDLAYSFGLKTCITTNGTLLDERKDVLIPRLSKIHKISISLQAQEANNGIDLKSYLDTCFSFAKKVEGDTIISFRLWNEGGKDRNNEKIIEILKDYFNGEWQKHPLGYTVGDKVFLEFGKMFSWPDPNEEKLSQSQYYCQGLKDHIGILCDGTVVPCCLDGDGNIPLGNIFDEGLDNILSSSRASAICDSFKIGKAAEDMCKRCGYASRFVK